MLRRLVGCLIALLTPLLDATGAQAAQYCMPDPKTPGIDVSKWQGQVDWAAVKASGVVFAYARATNGTKILDEWFDANWAGMKAVGLYRGAYQFFRPGQDAVAQANLMLARMGPLGPGDLPPMIDVEETDGQPPAVVADKVAQWIQVVEAATGKKPLVYTGTWFWDPYVGSDAFASYPLWEAWYCTGCCPNLPKAWSSMLFWQYSSKGAVPGIGGNVDLNWFGGTATALDGYTFGPLVTTPVIDLLATTSAKDFRPEGPSAGVADVFEGDTVTVTLTVRNAHGAKPTLDHVRLGYWLEGTWLEPTSYAIETDWPAKDGVTFVPSDAESAPDNPAKGALPPSGELNLHALAAGETKRVRLLLHATQYSLGAVEHPDVRAWIRHIGDYYGEQVGWDDAVEVNKAGKLLRASVQHDVFGKNHWEWNGASQETEGFTASPGVTAFVVDPLAHALALTLAGPDPFIVSPELAVDAATIQGLEGRVRHGTAAVAGRLYFVTDVEPQWNEEKAIGYLIPGDGQWHDLTIDLGAHPRWKGKVTQLRLDPVPDAGGEHRLDYLRLVPSVKLTSGDADGDGALVGPDCDDAAPAVYPGAPEACNALDDDCDSQIDEGIPGCKDGCVKTGGELCGNGQDDDCNGQIDDGCAGCKPTGPEKCGNTSDENCNGQVDEGCTGCAGGSHPEDCNGKDDDCDGLVDEDFSLGKTCTDGKGACLAYGQIACGVDGAPHCGAVPGPPGTESCNGQDDDCDGETDEDFGLGKTCTLMTAGCETKGKTVCAADGKGSSCNAPPPVVGPESCNGVDDDCDGQTDEDFSAGKACETGEGKCVAKGYLACNGLGTSFCKAPLPKGETERCDGADNDCDGEVDEGFTVGEPCEVTNNDCVRLGTFTCDPTGLGVVCKAKHNAEDVCGSPPPPDPTGTDASGSGGTTGDLSSGSVDVSGSVVESEDLGGVVVLVAPEATEGCAPGRRAPPWHLSWLVLGALVLRARRRAPAC